MKLLECLLIAIGLTALASARPQGGGDGDNEDYGGHYAGLGASSMDDSHKIEHPHHAKSHQSFYMKNMHEEKVHVSGHHHGGSSDGMDGGMASGMDHGNEMGMHEQHPHHAKSHQKVWLKNEHEKKIEIKAHPHYHYGFDVHDSHTHDIKDKHETRDGHKVTGEYSVLEPDHKHVRIVKYTSDKKQGWVAKVIRKKVY